jgi:hypothetical protein
VRSHSGERRSDSHRADLLPHTGCASSHNFREAHRCCFAMANTNVRALRWSARPSRTRRPSSGDPSSHGQAQRPSSRAQRSRDTPRRCCRTESQPARPLSSAARVCVSSDHNTNRVWERPWQRSNRGRTLSCCPEPALRCSTDRRTDGRQGSRSRRSSPLAIDFDATPTAGSFLLRSPVGACDRDCDRD